MIVRHLIKKNTYYDSVSLMLISKEVENIPGVEDVLVGMGTQLNKELAESLGLMNDALNNVSSNDLFIAGKMDNEATMEKVVSSVEALLNENKTDDSREYRPVGLETAIRLLPEANMVLISVPGKYAKEEVKKALGKDLNVMLFSDNVSIEDELELKELAVKKELLMMGPDCGTAIINGTALAFANIVRRGKIGIVGASGTGIQEVTVLIDRLGCGTSQVIGTGGRDLTAEIGGLMMIQSIKALIEDDETKVIVIISKPPAPEVAEKILELVKRTNKPFVVNFIGGDSEAIKNAGAYAGITLDDAARKAVALVRGERPMDFEGFTLDANTVREIIRRETSSFSYSQRHFRGLYTGGTLADEAMKILSEDMAIYSNIPLQPEYEIRDLNNLKGNVCLDFGDDLFTVGRPHPMIDPSIRSERLLDDLDETVAAVLFDVVLGFGACNNPVGGLIDKINIATEKYPNISFVCSVCGTSKDRQNREHIRKSLEDIGVVVMPSNAQAARLVKEIMKEVRV